MESLSRDNLTSIQSDESGRAQALRVSVLRIAQPVTPGIAGNRTRHAWHPCCFRVRRTAIATQSGNPLLSWEQTSARFLGFLRLDKIKKKILAFALLATLIPSLSLGWLSYVQNSKVMTEKIGEELQNATSHATREFDLWVNQRLYELRVFTGSYEVSENLEKSVGGGAGTIALQRLRAYLILVRKKFADYEELMVINPNGQVVTTSAAKASPANLPANWLSLARGGDPVLGNAYWDDLTGKAVVTVAVPIKDVKGVLLGALAAKLNFHTIESVMKRLAPGQTGQMYLIDSKGRLITSSNGSLASLMDTRLPDPVTQGMFEQRTLPLEYLSVSKKKVLGSVAPSSQWQWGVLAETGKAEAYARTNRIRNLTMLIALGALFVVGLSAYFLGVTIVRPLGRLTTGANQVANGDLSVEIPVVSGGEIGYLTEIFNDMVGKLREDQDELADKNNALMMTNKELEELSSTDGLTGLNNRRYMMDTLNNEVARAERLQHHFSVLMIDIDYFKKYNDSYGHMAGDDLLVKVASVFKESIRSMDFAARYGGEEFLIMLPEHGADKAMEVAERIRTNIASATAGDKDGKDPVTVSIGIAAFPENGATPAALIASADAALYQGKEGGRNTVVLSSVTTIEQTAKRSKRSTPARKRRRA
jgi:diguanylate cyclase (GGDEF)-like protein